MNTTTQGGLALALFAMPLRAQTPAAIPDADRIRIAEAFRLAAAVQDSIWPEWRRAPFALLLVTADREFIVRHPAPSPDYSRIGHDSLLDADVFSRSRQLSPNQLATLLAVGGVPTIVIGEAGRPAYPLQHQHDRVPGGRTLSDDGAQEGRQQCVAGGWESRPRC
jgi:hypothetical protein